MSARNKTFRDRPEISSVEAVLHARVCVLERDLGKLTEAVGNMEVELGALRQKDSLMLDERKVNDPFVSPPPADLRLALSRVAGEDRITSIEINYEFGRKVELQDCYDGDYEMRVHIQDDEDSSKYLELRSRRSYLYVTEMVKYMQDSIELFSRGRG